MDQGNLYDMRKDYGVRELREEDVNPNPYDQFEEWFKQAVKTEGSEANAFTLSTIGEDGMPEGRVVLLKFYGEDGFTFYTNYNSRKANDIESNPKAAMTFYWRTKEQQVRIKGIVSKVDPIISDEYYKERPLGSRIGAWASPQSQIIPNRSFLEEQYKEFEDKFNSSVEIPRPEYWGGYLIDPTRIEFWQGRSSRLHDRIVYEKDGDIWKTYRLAP
ncbi:pyridoxamine 5'-phosphate oxidase [Reichenbachiella versicolor]|uniref:pyridoxamine 5'-phosphate oxidase n=1 Tax=Reichenbachiella versicolor TaxID=1821036 RepID=UPI000D6E93D0|nr:pyridoxamine 5'-phosphate oxidase [Reichenbachiella versicolor]